MCSAASVDPDDVQSDECHGCGHTPEVCECERPDIDTAATNHRTKNEPDGSVTKWESYDGGKSWAMVEQTYPARSAASNVGSSTPRCNETPESLAATTESREENHTMLMWDVERRRVVEMEPGERDPGVQSLGAMPLAAVDTFVYTGPLRTTRDLMIRRLPHALWAVDFDYKIADPNDEGFYWEHGHVEATWLGDALAAAGEIALRAADYSEKWAAGSLA